MENLFWIGFIGALVAGLFAVMQAKKVLSYSEGTPDEVALTYAPLYEKRPLDRNLSKGRAFFCFCGINRPAGNP